MNRQYTGAEFEARYQNALHNCLLGGGEEDLTSAYELGRQALAQGIGMLEIASTHHRALANICLDADGPVMNLGAVQASGRFLVEVMSAFEMRQRAYGDALAVLRRLNELLERDLKRIALAIHDEAGQLLFAAHLAIGNVLGGSSKDTQKQLLTAKSAVEEAGKHLRQLSHELHPSSLDSMGLVAAVRELAETVSKGAKIPIRVRATLRRRLPAGIETGLYRVIQEALTNVIKHARARSVDIDLKKKDGKILCVVKDDGVGFNPDAVFSGSMQERGLGLPGIQERMHSLNGTFKALSKPGRGSTLQFAVPLRS